MPCKSAPKYNQQLHEKDFLENLFDFLLPDYNDVWLSTLMLAEYAKV